MNGEQEHRGDSLSSSPPDDNNDDADGGGGGAVVADSEPDSGAASHECVDSSEPSASSRGGGGMGTPARARRRPGEIEAATDDTPPCRRNNNGESDDPPTDTAGENTRAASEYDDGRGRVSDARNGGGNGRRDGPPPAQETDEEYRRRVYGSVVDDDEGRRRRRPGGIGTPGGRSISFRDDGHDGSDSNGGDGKNSVDRRARRRRPRRSSSPSSSVRDLPRRLSRQLSRRRSSLVESLPDTPAGWAAFAAVLSSFALGYELRLQKSLTCPPLVFAQSTPRNKRLQRMLSGGVGEGERERGVRLTNGAGTGAGRSATGILSRDIRPSLWVGTRGTLSSAAAYALPHLANKKAGPECELNARLNFREVLTMGRDGARVGIDWEVPPESYPSSLTPRRTAEDRQADILRGPIAKPVVVVLHGINNDASFGYIRSLMRACTDRGWIAAGYNFRGCGGVPLATPRGYTGSYTGDLRDTVQQICDRTSSASVPVFLVGNSLGANLVTKYLGEEGYSGTLPPNVAGGVSLGNPLHIHSGNMAAPWAQLLGMGVRKSLLLTRDKWRQMHSRDFQAAYLKALLLCQTIGSVDDTLAPYLIRNDPTYPFSVRVGYPDGGEQYWDDASSFKHVQHVSVPLLKVTAQDDFLVYGSSLRKMSHCLESPHVTVVKTKCGGHLGWRESPPLNDAAREGEAGGSPFGIGTSWADTAAADFIAAVVEVRRSEEGEEEKKRQERDVGDGCGSSNGEKERARGGPSQGEAVDSARREADRIRSRL